jgi:hypothetical protein
MSLQSLSAKLAVFLPAVAASLILLGCGGGSEPAFSDRPTASFLSADAREVGLGQSTALAVQLDRLARTGTFVRLLSNETDPGSFLVPDAVLIDAEQKVASFAVTAARGSGSVTIEILPDPAYEVGTPSSVTVSIAAAASASVSLIGPDAFVEPGEAFFYSVQRNQCGEAVTVPLLATGDTECFRVPESVTIAAGSCTQPFSGTVDSCSAGSVDISVLPPSDYALDTDVGVVVLGSGSAASEDSDQPLGDTATARVTIVE